MPTADEIIRLLGLTPHPEEGGFFRETYRSAETIPPAVLDPGYGGPRAHSTAIYYLLTSTTYSAMHRVKSDEVYHFYLGDPIEMLQLAPGGAGRTVLIGPDVARGMQPQLVVPRGVWQGSRLVAGPHGFALLGATVAPGFDYADYEHGRRAALVRDWPNWRAQIEARTA
ncbi:MAG TPA: cupin domain-containing protein [Alphaproteobacteria bacterium]|jgi:predicted cupin superfamily sugar epimerase|nr:cupin domain-containing protein [Alphaproteobacteria bacterium]